MVHFAICEDSIAGYLRALRVSFWPNNQAAPPFMVKTESEKVRIREMLGLALLNLVNGRSINLI